MFIGACSEQFHHQVYFKIRRGAFPVLFFPSLRREKCSFKEKLGDTIVSALGDPFLSWVKSTSGLDGSILVQELHLE